MSLEKNHIVEAEVDNSYKNPFEKNHVLKAHKTPLDDRFFLKNSRLRSVCVKE